MSENKLNVTTKDKRLWEKNQLILDTAMDGFFIVDKQGCFLEVNNSYCKMVGYSSDELLTMHLKDVEAKETPEDIAEHIKGLGIQRFETCHKCKDGRIIDVEISTSYVSYGGDMFFSFARDVTERKKAEDKIRLFSSAIAESIDAITIADINGIITYVNTAKEKMYGYEKGELIGKSVSIFNPELEMVEEIISVLLKTGSWNGELRQQKKNKEIFPALLSLTTVKDEKGNPIAMMGVIRDITERKQAEEEAQKHQEELLHMSRLSTIGEMASGLAHELNQPLCAAMNYANACLHTVRAGNTNTDKLIENMEAVAKQTKRAGEVVNRIKDFIRKREPRQTTVDINKLVKGISVFVHSDIHKNKVNLNLALAEELPPLLADPVQIEQVLLNLVLNGIDAMADVEMENRRLTIQTKMGTGHSIEVAVSDTGKGASAENTEKMFDSFFTTKPDGLGIGLSMSRSIINFHKGRLWAKANLDCGMTFRFTLPVAGSA